MPGVTEKTDELIGAIQQSKEYIAYNELKRIITHESGIQSQLDSFRSRLFVLQNTAGTGSEDFGKLRQEYKDILENSQVMEYLSAEQALIEMMRDIYAGLADAVALDVSFLGGVKELNI